MRVLKDNTIGIIVDIQERLFPHIEGHEQLARNVEILIKGLQALEVPVVVSEQYKKGLGNTIETIESLVDSNPHVEKMAFSCCDEPRLMEKMELTSKRFIIIAGIEAHICVLQTAIDLKVAGYNFKPGSYLACHVSRSRAWRTRPLGITNNVVVQILIWQTVSGSKSGFRSNPALYSTLILTITIRGRTQPIPEVQKISLNSRKVLIVAVSMRAIFSPFPAY